MVTITPERKLSESERVAEFFKNASVFDIAAICEEFGYGLVILNPTNYYIQKEM